MQRPRVICHMMSSVDGRIISANWGGKERIKKFSALYERCHESFDSQAWMVGRVTMEKDFTKGEKPKLAKPGNAIAREPYIADKAATSFAIAVDGKGKLGWNDNQVGGDHVIEVLAETVSDAYLYYLQQQGVSYIFAGKEELDFNAALNQLAQLFPIETIMLEGGGHLNGSLLSASLIDELSLIIVPVADGTPKTAATFDVSEILAERPGVALQLIEVKQLEGGVVWLRYFLKSE